MFDKIFGLGDSAIQQVGHLDRQQWLYVFVGLVIIGFFCLRGFGSRNSF